MNNEKFVKGVERMVRPMEVGPIHYFQGFTRRMPVKVQKKFMKTSEKQAPYMGFVVEPYSLFTFYEINDIEKAKSLLPKGFKLAKVAVHEIDNPKYYGIIGAFNAHTSGFWGTRQEIYIVAEDEETGLMTWIIFDIQTNSVSFEPANGLQGPNADDAVVTQDHEGNIIVDIGLNDNSKRITMNCKTADRKWVKLDQRLWLEGNLSVIYGGGLGEPEYKPFSMVFDPQEVEKAWSIPLKDLEIKDDSLIPDFFNKKPSQIIVFPYSQHFVSDSPVSPKKIKDKKDLLAKHKELDDLSDYKVFSLKTMKVGLAIVIFFLSLVSIISVSLILFHLIFRV